MLTVNQQKLDLGNLKFGTPYNFDFTLTNSSQEKITVNKVILGCNSCTKASVMKSILEPGEETKLNVIFTPGSTGLQLKGIDVHYDGNKNLPLKFTAKVT